MRDVPYGLIETIELKPCPFCGHTQHEKDWELRVRCEIDCMDTYVQCGACKARGFCMPLPGHIDKLNEFMDDVAEIDIFNLPKNPRDFKEGQLYLWMAQYAAKFWNNRKPPRE